MARHKLRVASVRLTFASAAVHARQGFLGYLGKPGRRGKVAAAVEGGGERSANFRCMRSILFFQNSKEERQARRTTARPCAASHSGRLTSGRGSEATRGEARGGATLMIRIGFLGMPAAAAPTGSVRRRDGWRNPARPSVPPWPVFASPRGCRYQLDPAIFSNWQRVHSRPPGTTTTSI